MNSIHIEQKESNREKFIDISKGILMLLVVLGHSGFPYTFFIYLFHMSAFIFISGYLFKIKDDNFYKKIKNVLKRLYLPFVVYNLLFLLLNNLFVNFKLLENEYFLSTFKEYLWAIVNIFTLGGYSIFLGGFWFIVVLIELNLIFIALFYASKKITRNRFFIPLSVILLTLIGFIFTYNNIDVPRNLDTTLILTSIFYIGIIVKKIDVFSKIKHKKIILIISCVILLVMSFYGRIDVGNNNYNSIWFFYSVSFLGIIIVIFYSSVTKNKILIRILTVIGKNTFLILALHFLSFKFVTILYFLVSKSDISILNEFPVVNVEFLWIFYTLSGIIIPLSLSKIFVIIKNYIGGHSENFIHRTS